MAPSAESKTKRNSWKSVRKFFNDIHLWMGIGSGLILFVVCLSGTIYTFSDEIQETLSPELVHVVSEPGAPVLSVETIVGRVKAEFPGGTVSSVSIPADHERPYPVVLKKEGEERGKSYRVNPYTGQVMSDAKPKGASFFTTMFRLHRWLLLDSSVGRPIVGWATVIFTLILLTGLVIWFPVRIKGWKRGLSIKVNARWKRINHDLHNALGFYASPLLLVMALTGLVWSFGWYRDGMSNVLGTKVFSAKPTAFFSDTASKGTTPVTIDELLKAADKALPYEGDRRLVFPADEQAAVVFTKNKTGFFAPAAGDKVFLDQYTGKVLGKEIFSEKPLNERIAASIKPLHVGNVYGTFSKIIYFIVCLIATSLPVTGTIIWINKLRKKNKRTGSSKNLQRPVLKKDVLVEQAVVV